VNGFSGVHHKGKKCDAATTSARVVSIENLIASSQNLLFPSSLGISGYPRTPTKMPKANGGWGDVRDHKLCKRFLDVDTHR
jgi:alpha-1,6-mannosyl-glycoprotein beta-1,2-N-acetylglucosaminyltransferase